MQNRLFSPKKPWGDDKTEWIIKNMDPQQVRGREFLGVDAGQYPLKIPYFHVVIPLRKQYQYLQNDIHCR